MKRTLCPSETSFLNDETCKKVVLTRGWLKELETREMKLHFTQDNVDITRSCKNEAYMLLGQIYFGGVGIEWF